MINVFSGRALDSFLARRISFAIGTVGQKASLVSPHAQENDETLYEHRKNNSIAVLLCKAVFSQSLLALVISSAWPSLGGFASF